MALIVPVGTISAAGMTLAATPTMVSSALQACR
jgi:hypothetical protein